MTDITEQEPSREEVAMEPVDGVQESTSYRTQITDLEREWMDDMRDVDEVYEVFTSHSTVVGEYTYRHLSPTFEEGMWMNDMRNLYELYETIITPPFTVPNPELHSPQLPLEICMLVVDHIGMAIERYPQDHSVRTLWSCCLLCHAFLNQSRRYLYKDVHIKSNSEVKSFLGGITENANLQGLITFLILRAWSDVEAYHQLLLRGQALLPKLKSLMFINMPVLNPRLLCQPRPFPSVTELHLDNCQFPSVLDLRRLIDNFFPNISRLVVYDLTLTSSYVTLPNKWARKVVSLSSLGMYASDCGPLERWLSSTPTQTSIRYLEMRYSLRMLLSLGQNIEHLGVSRLSLSDYEDDQNEAISFGPRLLPKLKSLYLSLPDDKTIFDFCAMFSKCHPSSTLMKVRLGFYGDISTDAFLQLDNTLSVLPPHARVEIISEYGINWDRFPKLKKKGMLVVSFDET